MENKNILQGLADNPGLLLALRQLIESKFALDNINTGMQNEAIGQVVRANIEGRAKIDEAFRDILSYKSTPKGPAKINPAK